MKEDSKNEKLVMGALTYKELANLMILREEDEGGEMTNLAAALIVYLDETDGMKITPIGRRAKSVLLAHRRITNGSAKQSEMGPEQRLVYQAAIKTLREIRNP